MYDVTVIGGGPTGSQIAYRLARLGYGVVVLEQKEKLGEAICCTGIVGEECIRSYAVDESVIFRHVNSAKIFSPAGKLLNLWRQEHQACILNRSGFDVAMACRAQGKGAEYQLSSKVEDIVITDDRVRVEAARREENFSFEAREVVIDTGFG